MGQGQLQNAERVAQEGAPKNPRSVGEAIAAAIPEHPAVASTSIAGPGFVNIVLREEYLAGRVNGMMQNGISSWAPPVQVPCSRVPRIQAVFCIFRGPSSQPCYWGSLRLGHST